MSNKEQHRDTYREEAYELLAELEGSLLELEESTEDPELIGRIFRALHTIKGSGAMFGFDDIAAFTHDVETVFDMVRNGEISVTKDLINITLSARDHIKIMLDSPDDADTHKAGEIIASLKKFVPAQTDAAEVKTPSPAPSPPERGGTGKETTYRIRFKPSPDIMATGTNPVLLLNELQEMGECTILAHKDEIPRLDEINPELCYTSWDIILTTLQELNSLRDVFIFVEDACELSIEALREHSIDDAETVHKRIGEILVERGDIHDNDLRNTLQKQRPIGRMLVEDGLIDSRKVASALAEQQHTKKVAQKHEKTDAASSIRVSSDKLDTLVNLVGELVTVQARLSQTSASRNDPELLLIAEEVERLTEELRDNTMSVRMVPIGTMFSKFKRLVRDLSSELEKEVNMGTEGAETELDKTVIERMNDPLVHLIRNSIDHGVESPDDREALGKPREGFVHLTARHSGANVLIEITDDGAGLDSEAIRNKAIEKGLIDPNAEMTDKEIFSLVLAPGFSTATKVSSVSGRGVGMDVVKRNIEALRGSIDIHSQKGIGTTITLSLPLTLAIIEGLLVKIGPEVFVIPLSLVEECVELTGSDIQRSHGRQIANVRGEIVPYIRLRDKFVINGDTAEIEQIVITRIGENRIGFVVDHVIGEHQTVIKTLGRMYKNVEGVSGATILGDGAVALILDIPKLSQSAMNEEVRMVNTF